MNAEDTENWEAEFLKLNDLPIPDEWLQHWQAAEPACERRKEELPKPAVRPSKSLPRHVHHAWMFWLAGSVLFLTSAFLVFKYFPQKNSAPANIKKTQSGIFEPDAMRELNEIARRLGIKLDSNGKPLYVPGKVIAPDVLIKPLHAHLKFSSEEEVAAFEKWIFSLKPEESFTTPSLWILSLDRARLFAVSKRLKNKRIQMQGGFPSPNQVPIFEGALRVSFYIDRTFQSDEALVLFQHWHFFFELHNRFDLLERLKAAGVKMLYETQELWVFEIQGARLEDVMTRINEANGLKKEFVNLDVLPDSGKIPIRISVYLEGR